MYAAKRNSASMSGMPGRYSAVLSPLLAAGGFSEKLATKDVVHASYRCGGASGR